MDYLNDLPNTLRIIVVSLGVWLLQLVGFMLIFGLPHKTGRTHPQAETIKCYGRDIAVLISSSISFVACIFMLPELLTPFRWNVFVISIFLGLAGWIIDGFFLQKAPVFHFDKTNISNNAVRLVLIMITPVSIIVYHLANLKFMVTGQWQVSILTVLFVFSMIIFGMYFWRVLSRMAALSKVIK